MFPAAMPDAQIIGSLRLVLTHGPLFASCGQCAARFVLSMDDLAEVQIRESYDPAGALRKSPWFRCRSCGAWAGRFAADVFPPA